MLSVVSRFFRSPIQTIRDEKTLIKFLIVGASGTLVNEAILYSLQTIVGLILAQAVGVELSIINNFIWNDSFTFRQVREDMSGKSRNKPYRLLKYNFLGLSTFTLNLIIYTLLILELGRRWYISCSLVAILIAFGFNYFGSSRWAWKNHRAQNSENSKELMTRISSFGNFLKAATNES